MDNPDSIVLYTHHTVCFRSDVVVSIGSFEKDRRPYDANMLSGVLVNYVAFLVQGYELVATVRATSQYMNVAVRSELTEVEEGLTRMQKRIYESTIEELAMRLTIMFSYCSSE